MGSSRVTVAGHMAAMGPCACRDNTDPVQYHKRLDRLQIMLTLIPCEISSLEELMLEAQEELWAHRYCRGSWVS